jgi:hypothetical protein
VFTDPQARASFADWDRLADEQVAAFKYGPFRADRHVAALADELSVAQLIARERSQIGS